MERAKGLLADKEAVIRLNMAERMDYELKPKHIESVLTDCEAGIRKAWALRMDFTPTSDHVERGLTDEDSKVRAFSLNDRI